MRLIDADEIIKTYEKETGYTWSAKGILECPKCFIDDAPTVEPTFGLFKELLCTDCEKRPQGEWIICNQDDGGIHKIECPFCKYVNGRDFDGLINITFKKLPPFCESCGAKLRGKEE